jgi:ATP-binding cassette subfamily B protein
MLIRRMLALSWRYRWGCIKLLMLQVVLLATALGAVQLGGLGIDLVRYSIGDTPDRPHFPFGWELPADWSPLSQVVAIGLTTLGVALLRAWLNYVYSVESGILIHEEIVVDLRAAVYDKLQRLSFRFFDANASGSLINRVTGDVQAVRSFVDAVLVNFVILLLSLVCYLTYMVRIHVGLTLACLATTPIMWLVTVKFSRMVRPQYDRNRELVDQMVLTLTENLQGVQVVKGFGRESEEIAKFQNASTAVQTQQHNIFWRISVFTPIIQLLAQINLVVLLAYGGYLVATDQIALGTGLVVFAGLLQQFSSQVANLANVANTVQQSLSGARRVFEVLDTPEEIKSEIQSVPLERARGEIAFENVSFGYLPNVPVLKEVSFHIRAGQRVAILGETGSGKSTLLSLITRFYDPTQGRVLIDGIDLKRLALEDLRRNIGSVFQESFLFSNTIAANIAFGHPNATPESIQRVSEIAAAHEFIGPLADGYDTVLGEYGMNLSGGQRQRLAIARALLLDPPILLLDDPAASIDPETEHEILNAMRSAMAGRTTLIVAHRLSTLRQADVVIVLEDGRISQMGSHRELLRQAGHYREVALSQGISISETEANEREVAS